jgi:hypothetical protein
MLKYLASLLLLCSACVDDDPASVDETNQDVVALGCPGITTTGAPTLYGLGGTYQRYGAVVAGEPVRMTLFALDDHGNAVGTFFGTRATESGLASPYAGQFRALPDNPAIGAALSLDTDSDGELDETYWILGLSRSFGLVRGLCLVGANHPFLLSRLY